MTQTQANDDGGGIGRREYIRLGIGATAAVGGIGAGSTPAAAQSCDPEQSLSCSYGDEPDYGVSYLVGRVKEHWNGLGDSADYDQLEADSFHNQAYFDGKTMQSANKSVLTTLENLIQNAKSVAYQQARAAVLEGLNNGLSPANAQAKGEQAVKDYIAPNQANLVERWTVAITQIEMAQQRLQNISGLSYSDVWRMLAANQTTMSFGGFASFDYTLVDGSTVETRYIDSSGSDNYRVVPWGPADNYYNLRVRSVPDDSDKNEIRTLYSDRFGDVMQSLITAHDEAISEVQTWVAGFADSYQASDISTEQITQPSDLWQMSSDDADTPYAAADLAGLGLEINQDSQVDITLLTDGVQRSGSVYLSKSPIGEALESGSVYDPALSRTTDSNENYTDSTGDYAGTESDPYPIDGLAFIAYNTDGASTYDQINQPFRVDSVIGADGSELQSAGFKPSTGQQTTTTDIDELRDQLQSINDEIIRLEKEKRELATGGAGGFLEGANTNLLIALGALAGAGYLFGGDS